MKKLSLTKSIRIYILFFVLLFTYYTGFYVPESVNKYIDLIVHPAMTDNYNFSKSKFEHFKYNEVDVYISKDNINIFIEKYKSYKDSILLKVIEEEDFGDTHYAKIKRRRRHIMFFDTKIIEIINKSNASCEIFKRDFGLKIKEKLNNKYLTLNFKIKNNNKNIQIYNDTTIGYNLPRVFLKCKDNKFIFIKSKEIQDLL